MEILISFRDYESAVNLANSNLAREQLARASVAVAEERLNTYLSITTDRAGVLAGQEPEDVLKDARKTLNSMGALENVTQLDGVVERLAVARQLAEVASAGALDMRAGQGAQIFAAYAILVRELNTLRLALLAQEQPADQETAVAFQLRRYTNILMEMLSQNRALVQRLTLSRPGPHLVPVRSQAEGIGNRSDLAAELLRDQPLIQDMQITSAVAEIVQLYENDYRPAEKQVLAFTGQAVPPAEIAAAWQAQAKKLAVTGAILQDALFIYSRSRLEHAQTVALSRLLWWVGYLLLGLAAVAVGLRTVLKRIVRPLEALRSSMLRLAEGDLDTPLPAYTQKDEVGIMADALRVFKANAVRRARLQEERLAMHGRLKSAYRQLKLDMEAAASVQEALLPPSARLGGVKFAGLLRPSHFISGDTYDVLRQPNGTVHFFHVDVAGHGAGAALVSVASHCNLTQAVLRRQSGETLADTAEKINQDWPEHLPFFTMVLGALNPEAGHGVLIQAGHPPPLLMRQSGEVEQIGDGGLPVGVMNSARYDEVHFAFKPGDRLMVYSDGLTEAENPSGQAFSEERLLACVNGWASLSTDDMLATLLGTLKNWRASENFEDDVTVLILEATENEHFARVA